jgi:hypothetical protein
MFVATLGWDINAANQNYCIEHRSFLIKISRTEAKRFLSQALVPASEGLPQLLTAGAVSPVGA